ncbi:MAG: hypothetical protein EA425_01425 [Puniceicoccaceae bacterium]|nr:MAG: hypothetical protein EA425_01425 [Puniceicoccaceae bacterium]
MRRDLAGSGSGSGLPRHERSSSRALGPATFADFSGFALTHPPAIELIPPHRLRAFAAPIAMTTSLRFLLRILRPFHLRLPGLALAAILAASMASAETPPEPPPVATPFVVGWEQVPYPWEGPWMGTALPLADFPGDFGVELVQVAVGGPFVGVPISTTGFFMLALGVDGRIYGWQRSPGGVVPSYSVVGRIPQDLDDVVQIAAGENHALALRADGTVAAWRSDFGPALLPPETWTDVVAIGTLGVSSFAIQSDGTFLSWPTPSGIPENPGPVRQVVVHQPVLTVLMEDSSVEVWGAGEHAVGEVPEDLGEVVQVASTPGAAAALRADGTVVVWGDLRDGLLSPPEGLSDVVAIEGGRYYFVAVKSDGSVVSWGGDEEAFVFTKPKGLRDVVRVSSRGPYTFAMVGENQLPDPFESINTYATANGIRVVWERLPSIARARNYIVERRIDDGDWETIATLDWLADSFEDESVVPGSTHHYRVRTANAAGAAEASLVSTLELTLPSVPEAPSFQRRAGEVSTLVRWQPSADRNAVTVLERRQADSGDWEVRRMVEPPRASHIDIHTLDHLAYDYRLRAFNAAGSSDYSQIAVSEVRRPGFLFPGPGAQTGLQHFTPGMPGVLQVVDLSNRTLTLDADGAVAAWGSGIDHPGENLLPDGLPRVVQLLAYQGLPLLLLEDGTVALIDYDGTLQAGPHEALAGVVQLAAGSDHLVALSADGTVAAVGANEGGQTDVPEGLENVVQVVASGTQSGALLADGSVRVWGNQNISWHLGRNITAVPDLSAPAVGLVSGHRSFLAVLADGSLVAWGTVSGTMSPVVPDVLSDLVLAAGDAGLAMAARDDGTVFYWWLSHHQPATALEFPGRVAQMAIHQNRSVVLVEAFPLGELPIDFEVAFVPEGFRLTWAETAWLGVDGFRVERSIDGGDWETLATLGGLDRSFLDTAPVPGAEHTYRLVAFNDLGDSTPLEGVSVHLIPPPAPGGLRVETGPGRQAVLRWDQPDKKAGAIRIERREAGADAWVVRGVIDGRRQSFIDTGTQAGATYDYRLVAVNPAGESPASPEASLTMPSPGQVLAWSFLTPEVVHAPAGSSEVVQVTGGWTHAVALLADGSVIGWGDNDAGQLDIPADLGPVVQLAASHEFTIALLEDGTVRAWGSGDYGRLNIPEGLNDVVRVAAGGQRVAAVKRDGSVVVWGASFLSSNPDRSTALGDVVSVAISHYLSFPSEFIVLKGDGSVVGFTGVGSSLSVPDTIVNAVEVAAGTAHWLALLADGSVEAWGSNTNGQTDVPADLGPVSAIVGGGSYSVALLKDGTLRGWGAGVGELAFPEVLTTASRIGLGGQLFAIWQPVDPPAAPVLEGIEVFKDGLRLSWSHVMLHTSYIVERRIGEGPWGELAVLDAAVLNYTDTEVVAGALHAYRVMSANDIGPSEPSEALSLLLVAPPGPAAASARLLRPVSGLVTWDELDSLAGSLAMERQMAGSSDWLQVAEVSARQTFAHDPGLPPASSMRYRIRTVNPAGTSAWVETGWIESLPAGRVVATGANTYNLVTAGAELLEVVQISAGIDLFAVVFADGSVAAWGRATDGELRRHDPVHEAVQVAIQGSSAGAGVFVLRRDGSVVRWFPATGETTAIPEAAAGLVQVAASSNQAYALRADGTVLTLAGSQPAPADLTGVVQVSNQLALFADGTVAGWANGEVTPVPALTGIVQVARAGPALALDTAGQVYWFSGSGAMLEAGVPAAAMPAADVSVGGMYMMALRTDGESLNWMKAGLGPPWPTTAGPSGVVQVAQGFLNQAAGIAPDVPQGPAGLVALAAEDGIRLSWLDRSAIETGYQVQRAPQASPGDWSAIATLGPDAETYLDTEVALGETWHYQVRAENAEGLSAPSNTVAITAAEPSGFDLWLAAAAGPADLAAASSTAPLGQVPGHGLTHLERYALGMAMDGYDATRMPVLGLTEPAMPDGAVYLTLTFTLVPDDPALSYRIERTADYQTWSFNGDGQGGPSVEVEETGHPDGSRTVVARSLTPIGPGGEALRVRFTYE